MMNKMPPKLFWKLFQWYCHPGLRDHIEGDLIEEYRERLLTKGKWNADIRFAADVLLLFRKGIIRPMEGHRNLNTYGMYKSYLKIGWRSILKNKGYSFINIGGLAMGMTVAMLIGLWMADEIQFNTYHINYERIARVARNTIVNGETRTNTYLPLNVGEELRTKYRDNFSSVVSAYPVEEYFLTAGEKKISLRGEFIDSNGPSLFTLKMRQGTLSGLTDQHSIFLSRSTALILFGNDDPINKTLKINNLMDAIVTGVYDDLPHNSHFYDVSFFAPLDLLMSAEPWMKEPGFTNNFLNLYVLLEEGVSHDQTTVNIKDVILNNIGADSRYAAMKPQLFLHPMSQWHLYSEWKNGVSTGNKAQIVWLFGFVGAFVLALACINFMNLSTARSEKRAKEVGLRKAIGSRQGQLISQFFSESFLVVAFAFVMTLVIVTLSLGWFNELAGKMITIPWTNINFWFISAGFIFITGLLAGSYPAFYLSSFKPVSVLKGTLHLGKLTSLPRKVLVVVQFTVSILLIIGTIVVYQQIQYAKDRPVGYSREGLIMIQMTSPDFYEKYETLAHQLKNSGAVVEVAESSSPVTDVWSSNSGFDWDGRDPSNEPVFATLAITPEYGKVVEWQFIDGRDFSRDLASDSAGFVINEAAANVLGFDDPVGKTIRWSSWRTKATAFTVLGVVRDMVMTSPYKPQLPTIYFISGESLHFINIRTNPDRSISEALSTIGSVFKNVIPAAPFDYKFADEEYSLKFASEERIGSLSMVFAVLAILISCLGLFGLASFVAEQRTKEIGIRKVMGASVFSLWQMLSKDFVFLVTLSSVIAVPLGYYFMNTWLLTYEYRTDISMWVFLITCFGALSITVLTVSYQSIKAALANPVKSLRNE
jgi:putative ABC transport system permease protein